MATKVFHYSEVECFREIDALGNYVYFPGLPTHHVHCYNPQGLPHEVTLRKGEETTQIKSNAKQWELRL